MQYGQYEMASPESKSVACIESSLANVGDPSKSQKDRVLGNKLKNQGP